MQRAVLLCIVGACFALPARAEPPICSYYESLAFHDARTGSAGGALAHVAATCTEVESGASAHPDDLAVQAAAAAYFAELERVRDVVIEANSTAFDNPMPVANGQTRFGLGPYALRHIVRTSGLAEAETLWRLTIADLATD